MRNILWDLVSILIMSLDFLFTPMMVFGLHYSDDFPVLGFSITGFWTLDVLFTCFVGFYRDGLVEMRPWQIFKHYARGWMAPDVLLVLIDWMVLVSGTYTSFQRIFRVTKSIRVLRLMRMVRLFRLIKLVA